MISWRLILKDQLSVDPSFASTQVTDGDLRNIFIECLTDAGTDGLGLDVHEAVSTLLARERILATAVGGIAFPHAGVSSLLNVGLVMAGRFRASIRWPGSRLSDIPTQYVVIMLFPKWMEGGGYLRAHKQITSIARTLLPQTGRTGDFVGFVESGFYANIELNWQ
jgi:hypothetical protein